MDNMKWASLVAQMVKNPSTMQETWVQSLSWEDPLEDLSIFSLPSCGTHSPVKYGEALPAVESQMLTGNSATSATNEAAGGQTAQL